MPQKVAWQTHENDPETKRWSKCTEIVRKPIGFEDLWGCLSQPHNTACSLQSLASCPGSTLQPPAWQPHHTAFGLQLTASGLLSSACSFQPAGAGPPGQPLPYAKHLAEVMRTPWRCKYCICMRSDTRLPRNVANSSLVSTWERP